MSERIELIKSLRDKGASIRMIDDVASFVGSYESPVFTATVEFIIKIKNMLLSVQMGVEQEIGVEQVDNVQDVSFDAAKTAVTNDEELPEEERFKMLEKISAIELEVNPLLEQEREQEHESFVKKSTSDKRIKKLQENKPKKNLLLDRLFKIGAADQQRKNQQRDAQIDLQQQALKSRQQSTRNTQQQTEVAKQTTVTRMRLLKLDFAKILKFKKDPTVLGAEKFNDWKQQRQFGQAAVEKKDVRAPQDTNKESVISKAIDNAVKTGKENKVEAVQQDKTAEKGKFTQQVENKTGPRADDKKVADLNVQDAIKNLKDLGVRTAATTTAPAPQIKKEIDAQLAQNPGAQTPQKQR